MTSKTNQPKDKSLTTKILRKIGAILFSIFLGGVIAIVVSNILVLNFATIVPTVGGEITFEVMDSVTNKSLAGVTISTSDKEKNDFLADESSRMSKLMGDFGDEKTDKTGKAKMNIYVPVKITWFLPRIAESPLDTRRTYFFKKENYHTEKVDVVCLREEDYSKKVVVKLKPK